MKQINMSFLFSFLSLLIATSLTYAEEWVQPGGQPQATPVKVKEQLVFNASVKEEKFTVLLSDGKQKFGAFVFQIQNGENIYLRPRLQVSVPLEDAKSVKSGSPLLLSRFTHTGDQYELSLVANSDSDLPDAVITKK